VSHLLPSTDLLVGNWLNRYSREYISPDKAPHLHQQLRLATISSKERCGEKKNLHLLCNWPPQCREILQGGNKTTSRPSYQLSAQDGATFLRPGLDESHACRYPIGLFVPGARRCHSSIVGEEDSEV